MNLLNTQEMMKTLRVDSKKTFYKLLREDNLDRYVFRIGKRYHSTPELIEKYCMDKLSDEE